MITECQRKAYLIRSVYKETNLNTLGTWLTNNGVQSKGIRVCVGNARTTFVKSNEYNAFLIEYGLRLLFYTSALLRFFCITLRCRFMDTADMKTKGICKNQNMYRILKF